MTRRHHGLKETKAAREFRRPYFLGRGGDPIFSGAVKSLSRPGGNVTGLTLLGVELSGKKLELIYTVVPKLTPVGFLVNPTNPSTPPLQKKTESAALSRRLQLVTFGAANPTELDAAFKAAAKAHVKAMITMPDATFWNFRQRLVVLARSHPAQTARNRQGSWWGQPGTRAGSR